MVTKGLQNGLVPCKWSSPVVEYRHGNGLDRKGRKFPNNARKEGGIESLYRIGDAGTKPTNRKKIRLAEIRWEVGDGWYLLHPRFKILANRIEG